MPCEMCRNVRDLWRFISQEYMVRTIIINSNDTMEKCIKLYNFISFSDAEIDRNYHRANQDMD